MDFIKTLPTEISQKIFEYLSAPDLARCCSVSKNWRDLANCDSLWMKLIKMDGFEDELLVPLREDSEAGSCCTKKRMYGKRAQALLNWKLDRWRELEIPAVNWVASLGNDSILVVQRFDGVLLMYDLETLAPVQSFPLSTKSKSWGYDHSVLVVGYPEAALVFRLNGRTLEFDKGFRYKSEEENLSFDVTDDIDAFTSKRGPYEATVTSGSFMTAVVASDGEDSPEAEKKPYDVTVAHTTELSLVLHCRRPRSVGYRLYFSLTTGAELRREPLDPDVIHTSFNKEFIFKVYRDRLLCEGLAGKRRFEGEVDATLVEHYTKNMLYSNDSVILLEAFYTTCDHVVRAWDWEGAFLRHAQIPSDSALALHPTSPAVLQISRGTVSLTDVRTNFPLWKQQIDNLDVVCRIHHISSTFTCLELPFTFLLVDLRDGTTRFICPFNPNVSPKFVVGATTKCLSRMGLQGTLQLRVYAE